MRAIPRRQEFQFPLRGCIRDSGWDRADEVRGHARDHDDGRGHERGRDHGLAPVARKQYWPRDSELFLMCLLNST